MPPKISLIADFYSPMMPSAILPLIAFTLATSAFGQTLKGVARDAAGTVRVTMKLRSGHPVLIDLDYSPVSMLRSGDVFDVPVLEYAGAPGSGFRTVSLFKTFRTHLTLDRLEIARPGRLAGRLRAIGSTDTKTELSTDFIPNSGGPRVKINDPSTTTTEYFRDSTAVSLTASAQGGLTTFWRFLDKNPVHGTDEVALTIRKIGAGPAWTVRIFTSRRFMFGDEGGYATSKQRGTLRTVNSAR